MSVTQAEAARPSTVTVTLSREGLLRRVLLAGFAIELALFLMDATLNHAGWLSTKALQRLMNTTREDALASWFGVTQTFCVGLVGVWAAAVERARGASRRTVIGWSIVGACFLYLALDDGSALHERFGTWFSSRAEANGTWLPSYGWQVLFAPIFGGMGLFLLAFLWRELPDRASRIGVVASIAMMASAVGLDFFEGLDPESAWNPYVALGRIPAVALVAEQGFGDSGYELVEHFSKSIEECTEMAAMTVMLWVLLRSVTSKAPEQRWTFG